MFDAIAHRMQGLGLSLIVLCLDQLTKGLATHFLTLYEPLPLTSFFNLTLAYNTGAAFSLFAHAKHSVLLLSLLATAVSVGVFVWLLCLPQNKANRKLRIALALLLGGALGNLMDRVLYGYVVDFMDLYWHVWHWPAFNVADMCLCLAVGMLGFMPKQIANSE